MPNTPDPSVSPIDATPWSRVDRPSTPLIVGPADKLAVPLPTTGAAARESCEKWKYATPIRLDRDRMAAARGLSRCLRQARVHRSLWLFYLEHNLFEQATDERTRMIGHLRGARQQWRLTLGM